MRQLIDWAISFQSYQSGIEIWMGWENVFQVEWDFQSYQSGIEI